MCQEVYRNKTFCLFGWTRDGHYLLVLGCREEYTELPRAGGKSRDSSTHPENMVINNKVRFPGATRGIFEF